MTDATTPKPRRIPTAPSVIWENVRRRILPVFVFGGVVALLISQWHRLDGGGIPAVAESVRSTVTAPQIGLLREVKVRPYEWVKAGQILATFLPLDARAQLDLLQAESQIARLRLAPSVMDRNAFDFERLRVDNLRLKQEIAEAKVNLDMADITLRRNSQLLKDKLISEQIYDESLHIRDRFEAEVKEKTNAALEIEARMAKLRAVGEPAQPGTNEPMQALLAQLDSRIADVNTNWCAMPLVAPISGMVNIVYRQSGEYVTEREPIITIFSAKSDRVVAYIRQPYVIEPEVGMPVEVVTRTRHRQKFKSEISEIGAQVEVITNSLAFTKLGSLVDVGLPLVVNLPPDCNVRPGETVDVIIQREPSKRETTRATKAKPAPGFSQVR